MAEFTGANLVVQWVHAGGTAVLTGDHRTASITPAIGLAESTAGSDASKTYLVTTKSWGASWSGVMQSDGTAVEDALVEGTGGTLFIGPEGTAAGNRKYTGAAIAMGAKPNWPYENACEMSVEWTGNGALTRTTY